MIEVAETMDYSHDLRMKILLKDEKIRELEGMISEKDCIIEELSAKLDKFQVQRQPPVMKNVRPILLIWKTAAANSVFCID